MWVWAQAAAERKRLEIVLLELEEFITNSGSGSNATEAQACAALVDGGLWEVVALLEKRHGIDTFRRLKAVLNRVKRLTARLPSRGRISPPPPPLSPRAPAPRVQALHRT